jgi:hypothetical protein
MGLHQLNDRESPTVIIEGDTETYLGFPKHGMGNHEDAPIWAIKLIQVDRDDVTRILYPNGSKMKEFVWDDRATYEYLPFGEIVELN